MRVKGFAIIIMLSILISSGLSLSGCDGSGIDLDPKELYKSGMFVPELILTGDIESRRVLNLTNDCIPQEDDSKRYSLSHVVSFAKPLKEITSLMIFARSAKGISINYESIDHYYLIVNSRGVVFLNCDIELHSQIGDFPLTSVEEIMLCASEVTEAGIKTVNENGVEALPFKSFVTSYGLYVRVRDAVYTGETTPLELTTYNKVVESAKILTNGKSKCVVTLENDTKVLITDESPYNIHWAKGGLYLIEFVSPIKIIDYRESIADDEDVVLD